MTRYSFGDVVLVPFPFTDLRDIKNRPAVVVSAAAFHREQANVILITVSSKRDALGGIGTMELTSWQQAGLAKPSIVRPVLITLSTGRVLRKLGKLSVQDETALRALLPALLG